MQRNKTRKDLRDEIYLTLGHPIIKVNLTDGHVNSSIDAALKRWWRWHIDASAQMDYVYKITQADIDQGFISMPLYIDTIAEILPSNDYFKAESFATPQWQLTSAALDYNRFANLSLADYVGAQARISMVNQVMGTRLKPFTYARTTRRLTLHFQHAVDDIIAMRVFEDVDPERTDISYVNATNAFDDETVKDLAVAMCKQQWGIILRRFSGMTLPGNVTIDGQVLIDEGKQEENDVMEQLKSETCDQFFIA